MKYYLALFLLPLCILSSCIHTRKASKQAVVLDTLEVSSKASDYIYRASASRVWEITHTRVALSFNWKEKTADGRVWINIHPYFYTTDTLELDAKSMKIDSVYLVGKRSTEIFAYTYKDDLLKIRFNQGLKASDSIQLFIKYTAMPYAEPARGSAAITEDRGLYFINTDNLTPGKPVQIWTQGETESNSHWLPTIDKPNCRFTTQVELTVPDTMTTLSNGALVKCIKESAGMRTDIWKMDMPIQAYVVMFAIGKYAIVKDQWRGKEVNYYVEPEYAPYAKLMFSNTPEMIEYFSLITGVPYPWNKYDQVVARDYVSGAMENTSATLLGEFVNQNAREHDDRNNNEDVVSHELFHQWFGDYVTAESWSNLTLNESFANYGEQLWREHKYGHDYAEKLGYDDLITYLGAAEYSDPQLVRFYYKDREQMFDRVSYQKGGAILNYMRRIMGDEAFFKSMNIYLTKNALHSAEATQWRLAVEEATGQDWNWFFNEFYYHAGHPVLDVRYNYDDSAQLLTVNVKQVQSDSSFVYQLPLKALVIYDKNNPEIHNWDIKKRREIFTYPYVSGRRPLIIPNSEHTLVGVVKEHKTMSQWLQQFESWPNYIDYRRALSAAAEDIEDSSAQVIVGEALQSNVALIREQALNILSRLKKEKWHKKWKDEVYYLAQNEPSNEGRAAAFNVMAAWKMPEYKDLMQKAVWDSSYSVAGAALSALAAIDSEEAYTLAKQVLATGPQGKLFNTAWLKIGQHAADEDIVLFQQNAGSFYGSKKFYYNNGLYAYLQRVKDDGSFEKGLKIITELAKTEGIKSYRLALGSTLINLAAWYKPKMEKGTKEEKQQNKERYELTKDCIQKVMDAEKDPENIKDYRKMLKELENKNDK